MGIVSAAAVGVDLPTNAAHLAAVLLFLNVLRIALGTLRRDEQTAQLARRKVLFAAPATMTPFPADVFAAAGRANDSSGFPDLNAGTAATANAFDACRRLALRQRL
jgi:hypothetical protein